MTTRQRKAQALMTGFIYECKECGTLCLSGESCRCKYDDIIDDRPDEGD